MEKSSILNKVIFILRDVAGVHGNVDPGTKLSVYLPDSYLSAFAVEIQKAFNKLDLTELTKALAEDIKTLNDLTDYIYEKYND